MATSRLQIYLIDEEFLKENSTVYDDVDFKVIKPFIQVAQTTNMKFLLTNDLYDALLDAYVANVDSSTSIPQRFLDLKTELEPMILWYTLYHGVDDLSERITNKGIQNQNSEYSTSVSEESNYRRSKKYKNIAESYANLVVEFLDDNTDTYPEWDSSCDTVNRAWSNPVLLA